MRSATLNRRTLISPAAIVLDAGLGDAARDRRRPPTDAVRFLASLYSFGVLIAFTAAQLAVVRLRFTEPDLERPFRAPGNVRIRGAECRSRRSSARRSTSRSGSSSLRDARCRAHRRAGLAAGRRRRLRRRAASRRGAGPRARRRRRRPTSSPQSRARTSGSSSRSSSARSARRCSRRRSGSPRSGAARSTRST